MSGFNLDRQRTGRQLVQEGASALRLNNVAQAHLLFKRALEADRDCVDAYLALARLRYPGDGYLQILSRIHRELNPAIYVEIGVGNGASLARAQTHTRVIGIDPDPTVHIRERPDAEIIRCGSETADCRRLLTERLAGEPINLGFVDGLHLFERTLEDFALLESLSSRAGVILIHDCLPFDNLTSARTRTTRFWTGDVWRVLPTLTRFRPDLIVALVECPPSGLGIVTGLDPSSHFLARHRAEMLSYGSALTVDESLSSKPGLHRIANDWEKVRRILPSTAKLG